MSMEGTQLQVAACDLSSLIDLNSNSVGRDYPHAEIEYIDISSVGSGTQNAPTLYRLSDAPGRARRLVAHGDTILATVRPNLRSFLFVKQPSERTVASTGFAVLRPKKGVDPRFVYYTVTNQGFTDYLTSNAKGSAYPAVDAEIIKRARVFCPPLSTQRKIAAILAAYDDLIENNTRRIQILEDMAQMLYREWFVHFHFPGHKQSKMVESALGLIPEGWKYSSLFDAAEVTYGFPFKSALFGSEGDNGIIRIRDIKGNGTQTFTNEKPLDKYTVNNGDLLVGMDGEFHMGKWAGGKAWLNQRVVRFRPKDQLSRYYLFSALKPYIKEFERTIVGTTVAHLSDRDLKSIKLLIPKPGIQALSNDIFNPIFDQEINLHTRNTNLRQTRDLLLPRLISGELDVADLDIAMGELS